MDKFDNTLNAYTTQQNIQFWANKLQEGVKAKNNPIIKQEPIPILESISINSNANAQNKQNKIVIPSDNSKKSAKIIENADVILKQAELAEIIKNAEDMLIRHNSIKIIDNEDDLFEPTEIDQIIQNADNILQSNPFELKKENENVNLDQTIVKVEQSRHLRHSRHSRHSIHSIHSYRFPDQHIERYSDRHSKRHNHHSEHEYLDRRFKRPRHISRHLETQDTLVYFEDKDNQLTYITRPNTKFMTCCNYIFNIECRPDCSFAHYVQLSDVGYIPIKWVKNIVRNDQGHIEIYYALNELSKYWMNFNEDLTLNKVYLLLNPTTGAFIHINTKQFISHIRNKSIIVLSQY